MVLLLLLLLLLLLRGNRGGGDFFSFRFSWERGALGCIGVECSGMGDRFVRSDLVYYQLGDRGCTSLLILFFYKGYIF